MERKKVVKSLIFAFAACAAVACFAGCGDGQKDDTGEGDKTEVTTEWQFTGNYHELVSYGFDFYFLGNMQSDGSGVIYQAIWNKDKITYQETKLEWEVSTDRDGLTTFSATPADAASDLTEVTLYQESDGTFIWEYTFKFSGGYSRTTNLIGDDEVEYETIDLWKAYVQEDAGQSEPEQPGEDDKDELLVFNGADGNTITFYSDKTAVIKAYGGAINFEYTWELADGVITMTSVNNPSEKITSVTADGVTTITYSASLGGNQVNLSFTCDDISALEGAEAEALLVFNGADGNTITFYSDKTAVIKAYGGAINFEYTWELADGVITMTSVNNPSEKITSVTADGVTTITYSASLGGNQVNLSFTCDDISALN